MQEDLKKQIEAILFSAGRKMTAEEISAARRSLMESEQRSGRRKANMLRDLAEHIESQSSAESEKVSRFTETVRNLASM